MFRPADKKAQVVVFREDRFVGSGACYQAFLDGSALGLLVNAAYLKKDVDPGEHKLSLINDRAILNINAAAGEKYFIEVKSQNAAFSRTPLCKPNMIFGNMGLIFCLIEVPEEIALIKLRKLRDSSVITNCLNKQ